MKHAILVLLLFYLIEARSTHHWSTLPPHTETPPAGTEPMKKAVTEVKGESSWTPKPSSPNERAYWLEEVWYDLKRISSIGMTDTTEDSKDSVRQRVSSLIIAHKQRRTISAELKYIGEVKMEEEIAIVAANK
nr:unnamed protein product [Spirometra erinaceieuropaei]